MNSLTNTTTVSSLAQELSSGDSQSFLDLLSRSSASVLLIWDIIITYDQEVDLIWRTRNCVVKYLFLFIRYGGISQVIVGMTLLIGDFMTKDICRLYVWYYSLTTVLLLCAVDVLLACRVYAFCGRDGRVLFGLTILCILNSVTILVFAVLTGLKFPIVHSTAFFVPGVTDECAATSLPQFLHDIWISEMIFQSSLFFLVAGRFIKSTATPWNKTVGISTFYLVFIRDGIWTYVLLLGVFIASAIETKISGLSLIQWALTLAVITGSRLVLNLRSLNSPHHSAGDWVITPFQQNKIPWDTICEPEVVSSHSSETAMKLQVSKYVAVGVAA